MFAMEMVIAEKLDKFFKQFKHQIYKKGELLVRADEDPPGIFYLKKGAVKEYTISKKGEELVVNIFKPISFFPMSWAINNTSNTFYYEALTDSEVWRAPKEETVIFIKENLDILFDLLRRVYLGTDGILLRMVYLMSENAYDRVVAELLIQAKRFGKKDKGIIELKISEKDLASQSGMTRETVSREMKKLKDKGIIKLFKKNLIIKNLEKLASELV